MKVNWKDARKDGLPTKEGWYWVKRKDRGGFGVAFASIDSNLNFFDVPYWAEIDYPEPPEEEKVSELEKWSEPTFAFHVTKEDALHASRITARKLIEVMENKMRALECDRTVTYSAQHVIDHIKRWCGFHE